MAKASESQARWDPTPRAEQRHMNARAQTRSYNHPRWDWARRRGMRRLLIATYLVTVAAVGWADALRRGVPGSLTGRLWLVLFVAILVEQAVLERATRGLFRLPAGVLDEWQQAVRDLGYRYGYRILAAAATATAIAAVWLPVGRLLRGTSRLEWMAVAIAVVYLLWMVPTMVVAWIEPDDPALEDDGDEDDGDEDASPATPAA